MTTTTAFKSRTFTRSNLEFGKAVGCILGDILPAHVAETAAATCRIQIRGKFANGNMFGIGCITRMQTFGYIPVGIGGPNQPCVQSHGTFIELDAHESADIILNCFGLSIEDVYNHWDKPNEYERMVLTLQEIVETLQPELVDIHDTVNLVSGS